MKLLSSPTCEREPEVRAALATGVWSSDLREHLEACQACADEIVVARALATAVEDFQPPTPLPDPGQIWRRARLANQVAATVRVTRIMNTMQWVAAAAGVAVTSAGLAWAWPTLGRWLGAAATLKDLAASGAANPTLVIAASAVILVVMSFLDLNAAWLRASRGQRPGL